MTTYILKGHSIKKNNKEREEKKGSFLHITFLSGLTPLMPFS